MFHQTVAERYPDVPDFVAWKIALQDVSQFFQGERLILVIDFDGVIGVSAGAAYETGRKVALNRLEEIKEYLR